MVHNTTSDTSPSVPSPLMSPTDKTTWPKRPPVEGLGLERMMGVALRFPYIQGIKTTVTDIEFHECNTRGTGQLVAHV